MSTLCRDCGATPDGPAPDRCPHCASPRLVSHDELDTLTIAHLDCDAFYASVEKRDDPTLASRPVIVGGGRRGVVAACCYVARTYGIHSAMPMFKALASCPDAVVIRPDMAKYAAVGRQVRTLMQAVTPLVEPLSVDEAFLDLTGTERVHGGSPAATLARLTRRIEDDIGITASVGLSYNKFLAKVASDLDKPRGFAVIGRAEALDFLAPQPVGIIWGVGKALRKRLDRDGLLTIADLRRQDEAALVARYGVMGRRLARFALGEDERRISPHAPAKSLSAETTFEEDIAAPDRLAAILWPLCEKVSARLKKFGLAGRTVTLKLRTARFRILTRRRTLAAPTRLAETIYRISDEMLRLEADGSRFRLIG
ncbi:MAG: DNA polymerase IV, partial [Alphaproteobacteria bacterium]